MAQVPTIVPEDLGSCLTWLGLGAGRGTGLRDLSPSERRIAVTWGEVLGEVERTARTILGCLIEGFCSSSWT